MTEKEMLDKIFTLEKRVEELAIRLGRYEDRPQSQRQPTPLTEPTRYPNWMQDPNQTMYRDYQWITTSDRIQIR